MTNITKSVGNTKRLHKMEGAGKINKGYVSYTPNKIEELIPLMENLYFEAFLSTGSPVVVFALPESAINTLNNNDLCWHIRCLLPDTPPPIVQTLTGTGISEDDFVIVTKDNDLFVWQISNP